MDLLLTVDNNSEIRAEREVRGLVPAHIIASAKTGDLNSFEEIIRCCERVVLKTAYQVSSNLEDAKDISQEVFLKVFKGIRGFDESRRFENWLYKIVVNTAISFIKKKRRTFEERELNPREYVPENQELMREIHKAMDCLTTQERIIFTLRDLQGLSTQDVSEIAACSEPTVRCHSANARIKIRNFLKREAK